MYGTRGNMFGRRKFMRRKRLFGGRRRPIRRFGGLSRHARNSGIKRGQWMGGWR